MARNRLFFCRNSPQIVEYCTLPKGVLNPFHNPENTTMEVSEMSIGLKTFLQRSLLMSTFEIWRGEFKGGAKLQIGNISVSYTLYEESLYNQSYRHSSLFVLHIFPATRVEVSMICS